VRPSTTRPHQALLVVDVQETFSPPVWLIERIAALLPLMPSVATLEIHNEDAVPFHRQLNWAPAADDRCLVAAERVFVKHGFAPSPETIAYLRSLAVERVLVCGIQADTCVLAAGFALFDAGLRPTLIADLVVGSSLDRSGALGVRLWRHHFSHVVERHTDLMTAVR
jgi:nicotinamidase-related amidase